MGPELGGVTTASSPQPPERKRWLVCAQGSRRVSPAASPATQPGSTGFPGPSPPGAGAGTSLEAHGGDVPAHQPGPELQLKPKPGSGCLAWSETRISSTRKTVLVPQLQGPSGQTQTQGAWHALPRQTPAMTAADSLAVPGRPHLNEGTRAPAPPGPALPLWPQLRPPRPASLLAGTGPGCCARGRAWPPAWPQAWSWHGRAMGSPRGSVPTVPVDAPAPERNQEAAPISSTVPWSDKSLPSRTCRLLLRQSPLREQDEQDDREGLHRTTTTGRGNSQGAPGQVVRPLRVWDPAVRRRGLHQPFRVGACDHLHSPAPREAKVPNCQPGQALRLLGAASTPPPTPARAEGNGAGQVREAGGKGHSRASFRSPRSPSFASAG